MREDGMRPTARFNQRTWRLTRPSSLHHALLDRLDRHPRRPHELDRALDFVRAPLQEDRHDPDLVLHAGLADVEADAGELTAHLPQDRLLDLGAGREGEPAALGGLHDGPTIGVWRRR